MKWKNIIARLRYYFQYFPFTLNAVVLSLALWLCFKIIQPAAPDEQATEASSFRPLIMLMGKTALWFVVALIGFSILTTIICWLYYLWLRKRRNSALEFDFKPSDKKNGLWLETLLKGARRPFLGFIKGRLFYDRFNMTDKFILASNSRKPQQFWREGVSGKSMLDLPDIKEYAVEGGFVYFEDMLQLFSLPVRQKTKGHFYKAPERIAQNEKETFPRKTEQTDTRIEQLRRVEGEYLNYKDFESGDDVRRVVWKVYAKNRELVVRIPEIFDPYASHLYFYASFHTALTAIQVDNGYAAEMLNYYKTRVWTAFEALTNKEWEVKFISDQTLHVPEQANMVAYVQRVISNSKWQKDKELSDYFQPRYGAVLCISSFNAPEDVSAMLDQCSPDTVVYYVKLSHTFRNFLPGTWLKRIFIQAPDDRLKRLRSRWMLTPFRLRLLKQEKEIEQALARTQAIVETL